jgi:hypothetical protein
MKRRPCDTTVVDAAAPSHRSRTKARFARMKSVCEPLQTLSAGLHITCGWMKACSAGHAARSAGRPTPVAKEKGRTSLRRSVSPGPPRGLLLTTRGLPRPTRLFSCPQGRFSSSPRRVSYRPAQQSFKTRRLPLYTVQSVHRSLVTLNLRRRAAALITYTQGVLAAMTHNPSVPTPSPALPAISAAPTALQSAESQCLFSDPRARGIRASADTAPASPA